METMTYYFRNFSKVDTIIFITFHLTGVYTGHILMKDGELMDGKHRLVKAIIEGKPLRAVRFNKNPEPIYETDPTEGA